MDITYKTIEENDLIQFQTLRLELLKNNPTNFGSSYEEEVLFDKDKFLRRLNNPNAINFGVFDDNKLVGMCVVVKNPRQKMKHRATLNSMYIKPEYRNQGLAKGLLNYTISQIAEIEILCLSVVSSNTPAINLYESLGFIEDGIEKSAIKYKNTYYDLQLMHKTLFHI